MKKMYLLKTSHPVTDDMLPEYKFDYQKARPNHFAEKIYKGRRVVFLDPDIKKDVSLNKK